MCVCGCNLIDCIRHALELGCEVEPVRRTGEIRFVHPKLTKSVKVNRRRKDAPRSLTSWLNQVEKLAA